MANLEKQPATNKEQDSNPQELEKIGAEQREQIREKLEHSNEASPEKLEDIRNEALEKAKSKELDASHKKVERQEKSGERRKDGPISKKEQAVSFKRTMKQVQSEMPPISRAFSKFIHNRAVEKTSEVIGSTIARPNAILFGSLFAFIFTLGIFLIARHNGYPLSGTETMATFTVGWLVGLLADYLRLEFTGGRS